MNTPAPVAFVTCGPASEPVDSVRRITNFSTGELGSLLSDVLASAGFAVTCFRGYGATYPAPARAKVEEFSTNESLLEALERSERTPDVVFHAAALCDFVLVSAETEAGPATGANKISSSSQSLHLIFKPARKILPELRTRFPGALIVGWKYELDGTREDAIATGLDQIKRCHTDACVVNGSAYGEGFGLLADGDLVSHFPGKGELCAFLARRAAEALTARPR